MFIFLILLEVNVMHNLYAYMVLVPDALYFCVSPYTGYIREG